MKKIVIRTLGGKGIGYGHYYRCLSLAKAIKLIDKNIDIKFIINKDLMSLIENTDFNFTISEDLTEDMKIIKNLDIDLFIFDSYIGDDNYIRAIKEKTKLMLIDDNNDIYDSSIPDIIYNGNIHAEKLGYSNVEGQIKLLGSKYLIMKEEYWNCNVDENLDKGGILITTGGTDEHGIVIKILGQIKDLNVKVRVIIGPGYTDDYIKKIEEKKTDNMELIYKPSSLKKYISSSKIIITAGGSTVYEALLQRSIPILFSIADNQDLICKELNDLGIRYLGKYPDIWYSRLVDIINNLNSNSTSDLHSSVFDLVTGKGVLSIAKLLIK